MECQLDKRDRSVVLIVDDNRVLCEALNEFLSVQGHAVQSAKNGNEALRLLTHLADRPALIFLDLAMPIMNGWEFLAELRQRPLLADIPVVIMSGCEDVAQKAQQAGVVAVLRKPVEPGVLLKIIDHFDERT